MSAKFSGFWTPSPLVRILPRSIVVNPRNLPYYVCFWATPLPPSRCGRPLCMPPQGGTSILLIGILSYFELQKRYGTSALFLGDGFDWEERVRQAGPGVRGHIRPGWSSPHLGPHAEGTHLYIHLEYLKETLSQLANLDIVAIDLVYTLMNVHTWAGGRRLRRVEEHPRRQWAEALPPADPPLWRRQHGHRHGVPRRLRPHGRRPGPNRGGVQQGPELC